MPYRLPFSKGQLFAIEDGIRTAFEHVLSEDDICADTADEISLNRALIRELNRMMNDEPSEVPGFSAALLETVSRGEELANYDGRHVEKRPDLVFRRPGHLPAGIKRQYCGMFVECKIVDKRHTMKQYCGEGISRFVRGDYAWAMSQGMLLGYARDDYALPRQLDAHLHTRTTQYKMKCRPRRRDHDDSASPVYVTVHDRTWRYPTQEAPPGDIELSHLWLKLI